MKPLSAGRQIASLQSSCVLESPERNEDGEQDGCQDYKNELQRQEDCHESENEHAGNIGCTTSCSIEIHDVHIPRTNLFEKI